MSDTMTQVDTAGRNTKTRAPRHRNWVFTWNNYTDNDIDTLTQYVKEHTSVWQKETGESGTPHLQGFIKFKTAKAFETLKKDLPKVHWEVCKNEFAAKKYCQKAKTRDKEEPSWTKIELKEWQKEIIKIIESKPDNRTVYWYWEPNGSIGKTTFCKYLYTKYNACLTGGTSKDGACAIAGYKDDYGIFPKLILLNNSRSKECVNYDLIEQAKDGMIFSSKYHSTTLVFECPHVIIFSNEPPETEHLSKDRWKITKIETEECGASGEPPNDMPAV